MLNEYDELAQKILARAHTLGSDETEVYLEKSESLSLKVRKSAVYETTCAQSLGLGIRVIKNNRQGYAYTADFSAEAVKNTLLQAVKYTAYSDPDPYLCLPEKQSYQKVRTYDENIGASRAEEKIYLACQCEDAVLAQKNIKAVEHVGYQEALSEVWVYNSHNLAAYEQSSYCALSAAALGEKDGEQDSGSGFSQAVALRDLSVRKCAEMCAKRTTELLGAKGMSSNNCAIVFDPYVACQFLELLAPSFIGENVAKNKSMFAASLGKKIAKAGIKLIDDGAMSESIGATAFDGEGAASKRTEIISDGVLCRYLYDVKSAAKSAAVSTGNAGRPSYKAPPHPTISNYYLAPGAFGAEEIIAETAYGLYLTDILGAHTANTLTGDFSLGAGGILIEKGKLTHPVRGITIAGNLQDVLQNIDLIGNDLTFYGTVGSPTVRVSKLRVNG